MLGNTIIARKGTTNASNVPQFILDGFSLGSEPAPPGFGDETMGFMIGIPYTLTAGVIYASPVRRTLCYVQQTGGTIEQSNDGSTFAAITLDDDEQFEAGAAFIRAVTTDAIVKFKVG